VEHKVSTFNLKTGMYVCSLDRPWLDTPFLIQGFYIKDGTEINSLKIHCEYVIIDTDLGIEADQYIGEDPALQTNTRLEKYLKSNIKQVEYTDSKSPEGELPAAQMALDSAAEKLSSIMEAVKAGNGLDLPAVRGVVEPVIDSIIRNSEALMWLAQMQKKDVYSYAHSLNSCALAIAFGRHMGIPKKDLRTLAIGTLLMDIGKILVPAAVLNKESSLTDEEFREIRRHVEYGVSILETTKGITDDIINIALTHHERFNGGGYPNGIVGMQVPIYGRIAGIIDCYSAMTSDRSYSKAISPHVALQMIYNWRNEYFQDELVEQFLQCLGAFPTGSLVEMSTGEVGIIMAQNKTRRLKPKIMMLLDTNKNPYQIQKVIDLMSQNPDEDGNEVNILNGLDPGSYGIDPSEYFQLKSA